MQSLETFAGLIMWALPVIVLGAIILSQMIRILREYERGVIFRLGKLLRAKGPGLILLIPIVDRIVKVDLRVVTINVPQQEMMTRDNVPVTVDAVVYFRAGPGGRHHQSGELPESDFADRSNHLAQCYWAGRIGRVAFTARKNQRVSRRLSTVKPNLGE